MRQVSKNENGAGCPKRALEIFGDVQTLSIIDTLSGGEMRFCELQRALGNMNPVTLAKRLKKLEDDDIIERREETVDKLSVSYRLKTKGEHMLPVLQSIKSFALKYLH